jgi:hypothetical protein
MSKQKKRRPPIDRTYLRGFVRKIHGDKGPPISDEAIDQFARDYLDGKARAQQEMAICGPWLAFLSEQIRQATQSIMAHHSARHPNRN